MKKIFSTAALIFMIFGLIGVISETGPVWARYTVLAFGIVCLVISLVIPSRTE